MAIEWLLRNEERVVGHSGPLFLMAASKPATVELLEQLERQIFAVAERHGPVSFLMVVQPNRADRVPSEVKDRLALMLKNLGPACLGQAIVVDAKGLLGTIVRAFLTGLSFFTSANAFETKAFGSVREGLNWLEHLPRQDAGFRVYRRDLDAYFAGPQARSA